jgi:hypothetical protein
MKVICILNDPSKVEDKISDNFDYGLKIGNEYIVMGILTFKDSTLLYYLVDENGKPSWFPNQIFNIIDNQFPHNWFLKINENRDDVDFYNLIGFNELCNETNYFNSLLERDEIALSIYYKHKIEYEKYYNDLTFLKYD